jgi:hypothetical protein
MSAAVIAFMLAIGASAWLYNKLMNSTGNNTQTSLIASGIVGAMLFIITFLILRTF